MELFRVVKLLGVKPKQFICTRRADFGFVVLLKLGNCCLAPTGSVLFHTENNSLPFTFCKPALLFKTESIICFPLLPAFFAFSPTKLIVSAESYEV